MIGCLLDSVSCCYMGLFHHLFPPILVALAYMWRLNKRNEGDVLAIPGNTWFPSRIFDRDRTTKGKDQSHSLPFYHSGWYLKVYWWFPWPYIWLVQVIHCMSAVPYYPTYIARGGWSPVLYPYLAPNKTLHFISVHLFSCIQTFCRKFLQIMRDIMVL